MIKSVVRIVAVGLACSTLLAGSRDAMRTTHGADAPGTAPVAAAAPVQEWTLSADQAHADTINFSPVGGWLAVAGTDCKVRLIDGRSGRVLLSHDQQVSAEMAFNGTMALSSDGKLIASALGEKGLELWDPATGKTVRRFVVPEQTEELVDPFGKPFIVDLAKCPQVGSFSPDDGVVAVGSGHRLLFFDPATGKSRLSVPWVSNGGGSLPRMASPPIIFCGPLAATARFSDTITLWDVTQGKEVRRLGPCTGKTVAALASSPDGRMIASGVVEWIHEGGGDSRGLEKKEYPIDLWNVGMGQHLFAIKGHAKGVRSVAYSPDGYWLLSGSEDKTIRLWEIATGKQLLCWQMPEIVRQVAVSPDGRKAAAVLGDDSVTLFPVDSVAADQPPPRVDDKAFERFWSDLAGDDGERAYAAIRTLSQSPEDVPSRLGKRLHPVRGLSRLIADLDADAFDRREAVMKELTNVGAGAEPALRKALEQNPSPEARSRIERLLPSLDKWIVADPDLLRALRAIRVLERIGTPEARAVLEDLAKGAPEARQTQEAKNALDFLDRRAAAAKP